MKYVLISVFFVLVTGAVHAQKAVRLKKLVIANSNSGSTVPIQMVEIPTGTFVPESKRDSALAPDKEKSKPILISGYYISQTEVTNAQYKEFVNWVRDSIAARMLGGKYISVSAANDTSINWKNASAINYSNPDIINS